MKIALKKKLEKAWTLIGEAQQIVDNVSDAHAKYMDERSEKWHESDTGNAADMHAGNLEDASANIEEVVSALDQILHC